MITIASKPYLIDFAGNDIKYDLIGYPRLSGRLYSRTYRIASFPSTYGKRLIISMSQDDVEVTLTTVPNPLANLLADYIPIPDNVSNAADIKSVLDEHVCNHYLLSKFYNISTAIVDNICHITFTAKDYNKSGTDCVIVNSIDNAFSIESSSETAGVAERLKPNYGIWCKMVIETNSKTYFSPEMVLGCQDSGKTVLRLNWLKDYYEGIDIPSLSETIGFYDMPKSIMKVYGLFAGRHGTPPEVDAVRKSSVFYLLPGTLQADNFVQNLNDWGNPFCITTKIEDYVGMMNYGCDSGLKVKTYMGMPQYVYFINFNDETTRSLTVEVTKLSATGTQATTTHTLQDMPKNRLFRIPLGTTALSITAAQNIIQYKVKIYKPTNQSVYWQRTYQVVEKPYHGYTMLLHNRFGVLESIMIDHVSKTKEVESQKIIINGEDKSWITSGRRIWHVTTGWLSNREVELLNECLDKEFNYLVVKGKMYKISMRSNSEELIDEGNDLHNIEFDFVMADKYDDVAFKAQISKVPVLNEDFDFNCAGEWLDRSPIGTLANNISDEITDNNAS